MAAEGPNSLHIVSWNVASWAKALSLIRRNYKTLIAWMDRHKIDILCLQEVKTADNVIQTNPASLCAEEPNLDTFWAPSQQSSKKRGFNGVATFARKGLTLSACRTPLEVCNEEGRCILTRHKHFVIFNVYTPNDGPWSRALMKKMRFLEALRSAMQRERKAGKAVILAGDLNIHRRAKDCYWASRMLDVPSFLLKTLGSDDSKEIKEAQNFLKNGGWEAVKEALNNREFRKCTVRASSQNRDIEKWRIIIRDKEKKEYFLGKPHESESCAKGAYDDYSVSGRKVEAEDGSGDTRVARPPNQIRVGQLADCIKAVHKKTWPVKLLMELADKHTVPRSSPCCTQWFEELLKDDEMADTFAEKWPEEKDRFTCWDQYKNSRYSNIGARIDYIVIDRSLMVSVKKGCQKMYGAERIPSQAQTSGKILTDQCSTNSSSLNACTAFGRWKMAPFEGGGLPDGTKSDYDTQFYMPHTGMIYTPPQYSDHIAVSLLMEFKDSAIVQRSQFDKETKKTQPHKRQLRISSFFTSRSKSGSDEVKGNNFDQALSKATQKRKGKRKQGLFAYFSKKNSTKSQKTK
mmetsp:Transcript_10862/g.16193  ORF Transcript_10862/g.16193 Transcript_10862/m.16193 type:complete len:574 (-) Transcript_10862:18-1739(-)